MSMSQGEITMHLRIYFQEKTFWSTMMPPQHGNAFLIHYDDVIMTTLASQITSLAIVYSIVHSDADQRKHQSSASLAFVRGIHRGPVNSPHKGPVTRKMFPFDDVIMHRTFVSKIHRLRWIPIAKGQLCANLTSPLLSVWTKTVAIIIS